MKCFNHSKTDAIGICKSCNKGICLKCCAELIDGLACKNSCEDKVNLINAMLNRNEKIITTSNKQIKYAGYAEISFGILFFSAGIIFIIAKQWAVGTFLMTLGLVFIISSIFKIRKKSHYPTLSEENNKKI